MYVRVSAGDLQSCYFSTCDFALTTRGALFGGVLWHLVLAVKVLLEKLVVRFFGFVV